jgi:hypothetical protein
MDRRRRTACGANTEGEPVDAAQRAEISDIDLLQPLDDVMVSAIQSAWHTHGVLLFRQKDDCASRLRRPNSPVLQCDQGTQGFDISCIQAQRVARSICEEADYHGQMVS